MNRNKFRHAPLVSFIALAGLLSGCTSEDSLPNVQARVDEFNKQMMASKDAPKPSEQDMAVIKKAADDLAKALPDPGLKVGQTAPDFTLTNAYGKPVSLYDKLKAGPVVLVFYRGAWCPYCNIHLHALHESLPAIQKQGAQLITVTPQKPDRSLQQVKKDKYPFEILSDLEYKVAKLYRFHFEVPLELHELYKKKFGLNIEDYNGQGRLGLPVPGTYVISQDGKIVAVHAELDYKKRMEPADIIAALKSIKGQE